MFNDDDCKDIERMMAEIEKEMFDEKLIDEEKQKLIDAFVQQEPKKTVCHWCGETKVCRPSICPVWKTFVWYDTECRYLAHLAAEAMENDNS